MWRRRHYSFFGRGISAFRTKYNMFASIWYLLLVADRQLLTKSPQRLEYWDTQSISVWSGKRVKWFVPFFWMLASCTGNHQPGLISVTIGALVCPKTRRADRSIDRRLTDHGSSHLTLDRRQQFQSCTITRLSLTKTDAMTNILFDVGFHFQLFKFVRYLIVLMVFVLNL